MFFESDYAFVPQDTNGLLDMYEWEQNGTGSCDHGGGCIYLLSGGTSTDNSFADASTSGNDVFFITRGSARPQDGNDNFNIYDARVDVPQSLSPPACSGSGCQGVPPVPPIFATPSSVTFNGVGNFPPPAPPAVVKPKPKSKPLTRAQKLSSALKVCKKKQKSRRVPCEAQARRRYEAKSKAKKAAKGRKQHV